MHVIMYIKPKLRVCVLCLCVHMRVSEAGALNAIWGMRELLCTCAVSLVVAVLSLFYIGIYTKFIYVHKGVCIF